MHRSARFAPRATCLSLVLALAPACAAIEGEHASSPWKGRTLYSRVGMHVEAGRRSAGWHMYSSNHVGLPRHVPAGSKFVVSSAGRNHVDLLAEDGSALQIEYVARHHPDLDFDRWMERQFSAEPVDLDDLGSKERALVREGRWEAGMSREALFASIGYPPATLTPHLEGSVLKYELKKFNNIEFRFDEDGELVSIAD